MQVKENIREGMEKDWDYANFREKIDGTKASRWVDQKRWKNSKAPVSIMTRGQIVKPKAAEQQHNEVLKDEEGKRMS